MSGVALIALSWALWIQTASGPPIEWHTDLAAAEAAAADSGRAMLVVFR